VFFFDVLPLSASFFGTGRGGFVFLDQGRSFLMPMTLLSLAAASRGAPVFFLVSRPGLSFVSQDPSLVTSHVDRGSCPRVVRAREVFFSPCTSTLSVLPPSLRVSPPRRRRWPWVALFLVGRAECLPPGSFGALFFFGVGLPSLFFFGVSYSLFPLSF